MADRGRLYYDSNGELWEVDPNASISGEPDPADLQPVRMGEMGAKVVELDQQADDGTDRVFIRGSDGAIKSEIYFDGTNTVINPLTGLVDVQGALTTDSLTIAQQVVDTKQSFTGGQTIAFRLDGVLGDVGVSLGDPIVASVVPSNDPNNDHGYEWQTVWDDSNGFVALQVTETENAGGGTAQATVWKLGI